MKTSAHSEIEYKWSADHISPEAFGLWCQRQSPVSYSRTSCPDVYYSQGDNIVRHRWSGGAGELTCKQRKSSRHITDRFEVDLTFPESLTTTDITEFLRLSGWKRFFTLFKDRCDVFMFENDRIGTCVALYGVEKLNEKTRRCEGLRYFLEVEIVKGSNFSDEDARLLLEEWRTRLEVAFNLGTPLTLSLLEIYSDRRYKVAKKPRFLKKARG